jgi:hypothetical protein
LNRAGLVWTASVLVALSVGSARAQTQAASAPSSAEVVSTAPATPAAQPTTDQQIADWIKGAPPLGLSDHDAGGVITATPDKGIHGEAGAFVSNRGYGGYVAATMPVGKDAVLGVAVADSQYNGRYVHANNRSLAASLQLGQPVNRPAGCSGGVQVGNRYVEPLWASQFRGAPLDDPDGCFAAAPVTR